MIENYDNDNTEEPLNMDAKIFYDTLNATQFPLRMGYKNHIIVNYI